MVGAINAPTTGANTFDNFRNQASQAAAVGVRFFFPLIISSPILMITLPCYQQSENGLVGIGASASAGPQPIPTGASIIPSNADSSTNATSAGSAAPTTSSTSTSSATDVTVQYGLFAVLAGMTVFLA